MVKKANFREKFLKAKLSARKTLFLLQKIVGHEVYMLTGCPVKMKYLT